MQRGEKRRSRDSPSWPEQRWIEQIRPVGSANDEDVASTLALRHTVKFGEQLTDDTVHDSSRISLIAPLRRDRIELVEEDDAGFGVPGALENSTNVGLGLSDVHVEELGSLHGEEVERTRGGDGFGEEGLSGSRRAVEEDTYSTERR